MSSQKWLTLSAIVDDLLEQAPADREALARQRCRDRPELLDEVLRLLHRAESARAELRAPEPPRPAIRTPAPATGDASGTAAPFGAETREVDLQQLHDRRAEQDAVELGVAPPRRIGPYQLCEEIGAGGMGTVYRGERVDGAFEQKVAIKLLPRWQCNDLTMERFRLEQQTLAGLGHPHIARLFDGGISAEGFPYIIMEYVEGQWITQYCDTHALSIHERIRLLLQVAEALDFAHSKLIIHRDVKPSNLLVTADAQVKLLDFGIAKSLHPASGDLTLTLHSPMTPDFAAPEQLMGQSVGIATDVYQLGVLMYQLLTGRSPYGRKATSIYDLAQMISNHRPTLPSVAVQRPQVLRAGAVDNGALEDRPLRAGDLGPKELASRLSGDIDAIIFKALEKDPEHRYRSMRSFADDLLAVLDCRPVSARHQTLTYRFGKYAQRHPWRVVAAVGLLATLVLYVATLTVQSQRLRAALDRAEREAVKSQHTIRFLKNIFDSAEPDQALGEDITARELLERSRLSIQSELHDAPEVRAELLTTLGTVYGRLGMVEDAVTLLQDAHRLRQSQAERYSPAERAQTLNELALYLGELNGNEQAFTLFNESLKLTSGEHWSVERAYALILSADLHAASSNQAQAVELYNQAIAELIQHAPNSQREALAQAKASLANTQMDIGQLEAAEANARSAVSLQLETSGEVNSYYARYLGMLAAIMTTKGEYVQARELLNTALDVNRKLYAGRGYQVSLTLHDIAIIDLVEHKYLDAEQRLLQSFTILRDQKTPNLVALARVNYLLGSTLRLQNRLDDAEFHYRTALELDRKNQLSDDAPIAADLAAIGRVEHLRGKLSASRNYFEEALQVADHGSPATSNIQLNYALLLIDLQDWPQVESIARQALSLRSAYLPKGHIGIAEVKSVLGYALAHQPTRGVEAEVLLRDAWTQLSTVAEGNVFKEQAESALTMLENNRH